MLLLFKAMELQNRFAPLPQKLHIAFCVFATVFFIFCYLRYRRLSDILWMLICDITLILQFYGDKYTALTVGVCEIILFAMMFLDYKKKKSAAKTAESEAKQPNESDGGKPDDLSDIQKAVRTERSKVVKDDNDVISSAFDPEDLEK